MSYIVYIADHFHYQDTDHHLKHGEYAVGEEAVQVAQAIVVASLQSLKKPGQTSNELMQMYLTFGDDPFIIPAPGMQPVAFSALQFAKDYAARLCLIDSDLKDE